MIESLLRHTAQNAISQTQSKAVEIKDKIKGANSAKKSVNAMLLKTRGMSTDGAKELLNGKLPSGGADKLRALNQNAADMSQVNQVRLQNAVSKSSDAHSAASNMSKKAHDTAKRIIGNIKG
jgi:cell division septum initiation protein DivIVA